MLLGVLGAVAGLLAGLVLHWSVVQPSDDDLRAAARTLTPAWFAPAHEPVVTAVVSVGRGPQATSLRVLAVAGALVGAGAGAGTVLGVRRWRRSARSGR